MDWYLTSGFDDLLIPKDPESFDAIPFPSNWSTWCVAPSTCFITDDFLTTPSNSQSSCNQVETGTFDESNCPKVRGEFADGSWLQEAPQPDFQLLGDFDGIEQMDDMFPNSHERPDNVFQDIGLDSRSMSSISCIKTDGSSGFGSRAFCPSVVSGTPEASVSPFVPFHSGHEEKMPSKGQQALNISDLSEENSSKGNLSEETSPEGFVLQDFQRIAEKMTNETRLCFRDTFYRLAKNSEQKSSSQGTKAEFTIESGHSLIDQDKKTRKKAAESETNIIDRAVANLAFNKMDSNVRDFPLNSKPIMIKPPNPQIVSELSSVS